MPYRCTCCSTRLCCDWRLQDAPTNKMNVIKYVCVCVCVHEFSPAEHTHTIIRRTHSADCWCYLVDQRNLDETTTSSGEHDMTDDTHRSKYPLFVREYSQFYRIYIETISIRIYNYKKGENKEKREMNWTTSFCRVFHRNTFHISNCHRDMSYRMWWFSSSSSCTADPVSFEYIPHRSLWHVAVSAESICDRSSLWSHSVRPLSTIRLL